MLSIQFLFSRLSLLMRFEIGAKGRILTLIVIITFLELLRIVGVSVRGGLGTGRNSTF